MFYYTAHIFYEAWYLTRDCLFKTETDLTTVLGKRLVTNNCSLNKEKEKAQVAKTSLERLVVDRFLGEDSDPEEGDYIASDKVLVIEEGVDCEVISFT